MTKRWKQNDTSGKYKVSGESIFHDECHAVLGHVFPAGSEIVAEEEEKAVEESDELNDVINDL